MTVAAASPPPTEVLHATCVAHPTGQAVLILGPSGSGKSALALMMMGLGAQLVADDRTIVTAAADGLQATCPPPIRGLIEARGIGLIRVVHRPEARVVLALDLGRTETDRLPPQRDIVILGRRVDLVHGPAAAHFPAAILHYLAQAAGDTGNDGHGT